MSEMKHQFHVGDLVDMKPFMFPRGSDHPFWDELLDAYMNNPHRVTAVMPDGIINIAGYPFAFRADSFVLTHNNCVPIDDLI